MARDVIGEQYNHPLITFVDTKPGLLELLAENANFMFEVKDSRVRDFMRPLLHLPLSNVYLSHSNV